MRFRLSFLTGLSLLFMAAGLYTALADVDGSVGKRYYFITLGIIVWIAGNRMIELEDRIEALECRAGGDDAGASA